MEFDRVFKFRVEIYKGKKVYRGEEFDIIDQRNFFKLEDNAIKWADELREKITEEEYVRVSKKINGKWKLTTIMTRDNILTAGEETEIEIPVEYS